MIKAVKTFYNSYLFRSRLEARWAVFFDELKIRYKYEPEMSEVGKVFVQNYIPDFYLPELELYVEIKGRAPTENEIRKAAGWANDTGPVLILYGGMEQHGLIENVYKNSMLLSFPREHEKPSDLPILYKGYSFCECPRCGTINISRDIIPEICNPFLNKSATCFTRKEINKIWRSEGEEFLDGRFSRKLLKAYEKAKCFKFTDQVQKTYKNSTNREGARPTYKMINYAKYLCSKNDYEIDYDEIENMSFQEISDLITELESINDDC